ncbi:hypothetical protein GCM10017687_10220 [Streptomyces echinatus]
MVVLAELVFSTSDLAQVRFAVSPMWEVAPSFRLLRSGTTHPVHRTWADQVRPRLVASGLDRGWLCELIPPTGGYVPDFLNPAPTGPDPTLAAERDAIRAAPADRVRLDLDHLARHQGTLGPRLRTLHNDPQGLLVKVTEEIETYWELALAPYWARIRAVLDADILYRARLAAEHGTGHLLNDLHTSLSWDNNALRMAHRKQPLTRTTAGTGLLLIPSAFTGPGLRTRTTPPDPPPTRLSGTRCRLTLAGTARHTSRHPLRRTGPLTHPAADRVGDPGLHHTTGPPHRTLPSRGCPNISPRYATRAWSAPTAPAAPSSTHAPPLPKLSSKRPPPDLTSTPEGLPEPTT